jgi:hypothetical protein
MAVKYYTHFIAQEHGAVDYEEYRGVVEVRGRVRRFERDREIAQVLARSFDLEEEDIQILQWQQLH